MKKIILLSIVVVGLIIGHFYYSKYYSRGNHIGGPYTFKLHLALTFYNDSNSVWGEVSPELIRPAEWKLSAEEFENQEVVNVGFRNTSGEDIRYMTWGKPNSRLRLNYVMYHNGVAKKLDFGGFGCGTGIYLEPMDDGELVEGDLRNPLLSNPYTYYDLQLEDPDFEEVFKMLYGDSVAVSYSLATYSYPWNDYPSQMIHSPTIMVKTDKFLENYSKGKFGMSETGYTDRNEMWKYLPKAKD